MKHLLSLYLQSWLLLIWSALCIVIGAAWMWFAIIAALPPEVRGALL